MEKRWYYLAVLVGWLLLVGGVGAADVARQRREADGLMAAQRFVEAGRAYQRLEVVATTNQTVAAYALFQQGLCQLAQQQTASAFTRWERLRQAYPRSAYAPQTLALQREQPGASLQRERWGDELLAQYPQSGEAAAVLLERAEAAFARRDYPVAIGLWERFEKQFPKDARLAAVRPQLTTARNLWAGASGTLAEQLAQARRAADSGDAVGAGRMLDAVAQAGGTAAEAREARYRKGWVLHQQKQFAEAIACWQKLRDLPGPNDWRDDAALEIARTYGFHLNDHDRALTLYAQFFRDHPTSERVGEARYQAAGLHYLKKSYAEASRLFTEYLAAYPTSPMAGAAQKYRAECDAKVRAAVVAAEKAALAAAAKPAPRLTPVPVSQPAALWQEAERLFQRGDYKGAQPIFDRLTTGFKTAPEYDQAAWRAGQCHLQLDDPMRAIRVWEELVMWKPQSPKAGEVLLTLGNLYWEELDNPAKAQAAYEKAIQLAQTATNTPPAQVADLRYRLGLALLAQQQWEPAKAALEAARTARGGPDENAPPTELDRLIVACEKRQPITPPRAKTLDPIEKQIAKADLMFTAKEYAKAVRVYEKVVTAKPGTEAAAYALMQAGRCYNQLLKYEQALRCYRQFLDKYQQSQWAPDALLRAAVMHAGPLGDVRRGIDLCRQIVTRYPATAGGERAQYYMATSAFWGRRWQEAYEEHQKFLEKYPASEFVPYVLHERLPAIEKHLGNKENES